VAAVFRVEQERVDPLGEARVVELDREVVAALVRALRSGDADLGLADESPARPRNRAVRLLSVGTDRNA
jgi:hypothetical protein